MSQEPLETVLEASRLWFDEASIPEIVRCSRSSKRLYRDAASFSDGTWSIKRLRGVNKRPLSLAGSLEEGPSKLTDSGLIRQCLHHTTCLRSPREKHGGRLTRAFPFVL